MTRPAHIKLDDTSYMMWVCQFLPILRSNGLLGIVDGPEPCPPEYQYVPDTKEYDQIQPTLNPAFTIWEKNNQYIQS